MITLKETAIAIEHTVHILMLLKDYCTTNENIHEVCILKHSINDILKYIDNIYAKLLNEKII